MAASHPPLKSLVGLSDEVEKSNEAPVPGGLKPELPPLESGDEMLEPPERREEGSAKRKPANGSIARSIAVVVATQKVA